MRKPPAHRKPRRSPSRRPSSTPRKRSTVRHTRAIQRDRVHRPFVAVSLSLIWQQLGSLVALQRQLALDGCLWATPRQGSPQALSLRLRTRTASLFQSLLAAVLTSRHSKLRTPRAVHQFCFHSTASP